MEKKLVYKFRDCENEYHRKMLLENEICFASPNSFNDPFDCHIDYDFSKLTDVEKKEYIDNQIQLLKEESVLDNDLTEKYVRRELEENFRNPNKQLSLQDEYNDGNFNILNKNIGVFSCCQDAKQEKGWQNILLWSHYANDHKGFCVGFNKEKLCKMFTNGNTVETDYPNLIPIIPKSDTRQINQSNFIKEISAKSKAWSYENEIRFVIINTDKDFEIGFSQEDRIRKLPDGIIEEVTMGLCIDDWHKGAIIKICRSRGIKLYHTVKKPFEFSITRQEIDLN